MVLVDKVSKMTVCLTGEERARLLVDNVIKLHSIPEEIVSNRVT